MKNINLTFRFRSLNQFVIALFLFASPLAGAYAACCAGHGGVASCNKSTGHQVCKDGTASPTCTCAKTTKKNAATTPATTTTTTKSKAAKAKAKANGKTVPATTTTTPKSSWWGGKSTGTTSAPANTKSTSTGGTSAKGCCSRHGGVAQCNKSTRHLMCKDGSQSPSCACQ